MQSAQRDEEKPGNRLATLGFGVPTLPPRGLASLASCAAARGRRRLAAVAVHLCRAVLGGPGVGQRGRLVVNSFGAQRWCRLTACTGLLLSGRRGRGGELRQALGCVDRPDLLRWYRLDSNVEQEPDGFFLEAVEHPVEHVEALSLVLEQRISLGHRTEVDGLFK